MGDEERQRRAHEECRNQHERERQECGAHRRGASGQNRGAMENVERDESERGDTQLYEAKHGEQRQARILGYPATDEAPEPEAQHEATDDNRYRFDIDSEDGKEGALPDNLVQQRRETREEEQDRRRYDERIAEDFRLRRLDTVEQGRLTNTHL